MDSSSKNENGHNLFTLMLFQTWTPEDDILKNAGNQIVSGPH